MKFYYLGNFDANGKSEYINNGVAADSYISDLSSAINALFPEGRKLHHKQPEWLMDNTIDVQANCEITLTFVNEGAGYRNAFGYFIYPTANQPKTIGHITECYFVYPNASRTGSGGSLNPGDRIKLPFSFNYTQVGGRDIVRPNTYTFLPGYSVGFILYPNAWNGAGVDRYVVPYTSVSKHNPERAPELKFHTACTLIPNTSRLVMGIEDLRRDTSSCDHDFNDLLIIIDTNLEAITKKFVDTEELENEKNDPNIPTDYTIGYKKIFTTISGIKLEAVATLYIPKTSDIKMKKGYGVRLMTNNVYVRNIIVVPPATNLVTSTRYIGTYATTGYSWYNSSFTYTVGQYVTSDLDADNKVGIHFFRDFTEAADYDFSPTYKA